MYQAHYCSSTLLEKVRLVTKRMPLNYLPTLLRPLGPRHPSSICETPFFLTVELVIAYTWPFLSFHIYYSSSTIPSTYSTVLLVLANNRMSELLTRICYFAIRALPQDIGVIVPHIFKVYELWKEAFVRQAQHALLSL